MGVVEHGYTLREPTDVGVQRDPINMSVVITNKYIAETSNVIQYEWH